MAESVHDKLKRVRKPRVHITYDVETEGGVVQRELPFVVGVLADLGQGAGTAKAFRDRKFISIDRDNFNDVMSRMSPELNLKVKNTLKDDGSELPVQLKFKSMDDFSPAAVARQVGPLNELLQTRDKLRELQTRVDLSDKLEGHLENILTNTEALKKLKGELGTDEKEGK
jgi:type VI secretion system protein ImpB